MNTNVVVIPSIVVLPLAGAFISPLLGRRHRALSTLLGSLTPMLLFVLSLVVLFSVRSETPFAYHLGGWRPPIGIVMVVDSLTAFMLVTVNLVASAIVLYARDYMERYTAKDMFYTLVLLMLAGMNGVIVAGDLFNLFVFLEIATMASYALVAFGTERHALEAAFKYAVMGSVGTLFILLGIVLLYGLTSTLNMADMRMVLAGHNDHNLLRMVTVLFLMGFGLKAALVPFHAWLPDAHPAAPAPISAMLSGVLIKSLGVYALSRILYHVIGPTPIVSSVLLVLGTLSMVVGVLLAFGQRDLKRLLAYSSISQVGYVVLGIGLGTPLGILGGVFHLLNHAVGKALLFLTAGAVEYATDSRDRLAMGGLAQKMPVTSTTGFVAAMSIAGLPPLGGFWSKLLIVMAAVQAGHPGYALWAVIVSVFTLALFATVVKDTFFGPLPQRWCKIAEVPGGMQAAMVALALVCLMSGLLLLPGIKEGFLSPATTSFLDSVNNATMLERTR